MATSDPPVSPQGMVNDEGDSDNSETKLDIPEEVLKSCKRQAQAWEDRITIVRRHFEAKGYRVNSGLQFGVELVLYADLPGNVHSDFCVHVLPEDGSMDWREIQTRVRSMPDFHKTLILAHIVDMGNGTYDVQEIAMATEHAPFRHRKQHAVGSQVKKKPKIS